MSQAKTVDSRIPRGKAAFHTIVPALAFLLNPVSAPGLGQSLVALTGIAMAISVVGGPKVSLFGRLFNQVIRPMFKIGPGTPDDVTPHRFAEAVGAVFLLAAGILFLLGFETIGWALTLIVIVLAAINWLAGICVGCQMYLLIMRLRGGGAVTS